MVDFGRGQNQPSRHTQPLCSDRKSTRLNSSHGYISYAVFCLKKKNTTSNDICNACLAAPRYYCLPFTTVPRRPLSTLFPYTTLFRSTRFTLRFTVPFTFAVNGSYWEHRGCVWRDG